MANVFGDIFEAIRFIRQKKGTTETNIMTYVHDRLGKGVSIRTVLKTMNTLKRLVDCGLLIKKGNRYLLPLPCDSGQEKTEDNGDEGMDDDDDENDDDDEGEEEDEDEDDEDDDDDDDECNMEDDIEGRDENGDERKKKDPCEMDEEVGVRGGKDEGCDWEYKHIDSNLKKYMKSEMNPVAGSIIRSKKQKYRTRRNQLYDEEIDDLSREPSPARESSEEIDLLMEVEEGLQESEVEAQFINNDLSFGYEGVDRPEGCNTYRYKSPNGPPPPNTPGVHVERRESCCSEIVCKVDGLAETEPDFEGDQRSEPSEECYKKQFTKCKQAKKWGLLELQDRQSSDPSSSPDGITARRNRTGKPINNCQFTSLENRRNHPLSTLITRETGSGDVSLAF